MTEGLLTLSGWSGKRLGNGGGRNASYATPSPRGVVYELPATHKEDDDAG